MVAIVTGRHRHHQIIEADILGIVENSGDAVFQEDPYRQDAIQARQFLIYPYGATRTTHIPYE